VELLHEHQQSNLHVSPSVAAAAAAATTAAGGIACYTGRLLAKCMNTSPPSAPTLTLAKLLLS
jgi:hypothetical protein